MKWGLETSIQTVWATPLAVVTQEETEKWDQEKPILQSKELNVCVPPTPYGEFLVSKVWALASMAFGGDQDRGLEAPGMVLATLPSWENTVEKGHL